MALDECQHDPQPEQQEVGPGRDSLNLQRIGDRMQKMPGRMGFGVGQRTSSLLFRVDAEDGGSLRMPRFIRRNALRLMTPYGVCLVHRAMPELLSVSQGRVKPGANDLTSYVSAGGAGPRMPGAVWQILGRGL